MELFTNKIQNRVHVFLASANERVLLSFLKENNIVCENSSFIVNEILKNNNQPIFKKYSGLKKVFNNEKKKVDHNFSNIINSYSNDMGFLVSKNMINSIHTKIEDITIGMGDFHNGASTSIVDFNNNQKLVFKPTNGSISQTYFKFLDWINTYLPLGDYQYKILNKIDYHWQEFIDERACNTQEEVSVYYKRAGYLLSILYLSNGMDFHSENVIANSSSPVLIDHETIIQPKIIDAVKNKFKQSDLSKEDTVLDSFLLPNNEMVNLYPLGICGLGWSKQTYTSGYKNVGVNRFTKDWKMVRKFVREDYIEKNVPELHGKKVFVDDHLDDIVAGFQECYKLFLRERELLLSHKSPLRNFENVPVRYIWRPTGIYDRILKYMSLPKNLRNEKKYEQKIRDYLAIAYKNVPKNSDLWLIYEHEVTQMLRGDIPYFEINSSSRDLVTEHGTIKDFFELSCVENIHRKLRKLSREDLAYQTQLIIESISS